MMSYLTQLEINMKDSEEERHRTNDRIFAEFTKGGTCYMCGCIEDGTIEYDDETVNCYVCNKED